LSGLNTNIGLLKDGITWAYVIGVCAVAFAGKIIGGTLAARANKLVWRESFTIGVLMSCKGLVELIVLVSSKNLFYGITNKHRTLACKPEFCPSEPSLSSSSWH
jgi:Kef-type K+ transport system membrane component KefB